MAVDPGTPVFPRLPQAKAQLARKYAPGSAIFPLLASFTPQTTTALRALDEQRVNLGGTPYTGPETAAAAGAVNAGHSQIDVNPGGWGQRIAGDIGTIASSIPKLPAALIHEFLRLPDAPREIQAGIDRDTNPLEQLGNVAQAPGARLIPGSFIAGQFGTGGEGFGGLAEHPVFTALDVLPYAHSAAKLTPAVRAAGEVATHNAAILDQIPRRVPILRTALTKTSTVREATVPGIDPATGLARVGQELVPNRLGQLTSDAYRAAGSTKLGGLGKQITGTNSQTLARLGFNRDAQLNLLADHPENATTLEGLAAAEAKFALNNPDAVAKFAAIPEARRVEIGQARVMGEADKLSLSPVEADFLDAIRTGYGATGEAGVAAGNLVNIEYPGLGPNGEKLAFLYDKKTGKKILQARHAADTATGAQFLRDSLRNPQDSSAQLLADHLRIMLEDPKLKVKAVRALGSGYLTALESMGAEVRPFRRALNGYTDKGKMVKGSIEDLTARIANGELRVPDETPLITPHEFRTQRALDTLEAAGFGDQANAAAKKLVASVETEAMPANFGPLVAARADDPILAKVNEMYAGQPELNKYLGLATERLYGQIPGFEKTARKLQTEMRNSWQKLAAEGHAPEFEHRVAPGTARASQHQRALDHIPTPSQYKARLFDLAPSAQDPAITLTHAANQILLRDASIALVDDIVKHLATPGALVVDQLRGPAAALMARNPSYDFPSALREVIKRENLTVFDQRAFLTGQPSKSSVAISKQLFIPTEVYENLQRMRPQPETIGKTVLAAPMKLFRLSVLALSPRWQVNNAVSGVILGMAHADNPVNFLRAIPEAWREIKAGEGIRDMRALEPGVDQATRDLMIPTAASAQEGQYFNRVKTGTVPQKLEALNNTLTGVFLRKVWDQAGKGVTRLYDANQFVDDVMRNAAYFERKASALKKGMTYEESVKQGILGARDILQKWDTLTPIEREAMRMVFPFYAWTKTILKQTLTYPATHPYRMAIITSLANAERKDLESGIPQRLRSLLFLGSPDAEGNVHTINFGGANPFSDVANYATTAGFFLGGEGNAGAVTGNVNPILSTFLQTLGVDPSKGSADLYPDLYYDPTTGQLAMAHADPAPLTFLNNILPASRAVTSLAGWNASFRDMAKRDPSSAGRMLAASVGVPVAHRVVNLPQEQAKQEIRLYNDRNTTKNEALKSGDLDLMDRYPSLGVFKRRVEALQRGQDAAKYAPDPAGPSGTMPGLGEIASRAALQR